MKHKPLVLLSLLFLFSCKKEDKKTAETLTAKDTVTQQIDTTIIENKKPKSISRILVPTTYRDDISTEFNKNWLELYEKNGQYFLDNAVYTITKGYDECVGTNTETIQSKRKTLLFIDNPSLSKGKIESLKNPKSEIWPDEEVSFTFNNKKYSLTAEGVIQSSEERTNESGKTSTWHQVSNYKLYLKLADYKEELLINEPEFQDTFVSLLFVGDIDKDGKPDFIFDAPTNYEETRTLLFLSSEATEGQTVPKAVEIRVAFDC